MFCKCYFASIRDLATSAQEAKCSNSKRPKHRRSPVPQVTLRPVYLPAISYLVESSDGWLASVYCRFQQARRHSQGIAELSYVLLQYVHLVREFGLRRIPVQTHYKALGIAAKMGTVHIVNQVQALALIIASLLLVPGGVNWICSGGLSSAIQLASSTGYINAIVTAAGGLGGLLKYLLAIFGPIPPMGLLMTCTTTLVVMDVLEGRLTETYDKKRGGEHLKEKDTGGKNGSSPLLSRLSLFLKIQNDYFSMAHFTLLAYGLLPVSMAAWSLLRRGHKFEYIVAAKPN